MKTETLCHFRCSDPLVLKEGLELPPAPKPMGIYKPFVVAETMACVSGHGPLRSDGSLMTGRVGEDADPDLGRAAARQAILTNCR